MMNWIARWRSKGKKRYSWRYIDSACKAIADQWTLPTPQVIGISRGGLIPATLIAKHLNAGEVYSVGLKSYDNDSHHAKRRDVPIVYQNINRVSALERTEPILIVDDISDEGKTLKYLTGPGISNIGQAPHIATATIFIKDKTIFTPDMYHLKVPNEQWVIFPWET
jgi:xanthine phosphoribosyltransferase